MIRPLRKQDYNRLLELDRKIYPSTFSVKEKTMMAWYKNNPEFGFVIKKDGHDAICACIPLNRKGWEMLVNGRLKENECRRYIFNNKKDSEIGIHIYHIEKFKNKKKTYEKVFSEIGRVIKKLRVKNPKLKVIGISALCTTKAGISLFDKLNFKEREFKASEHILEKDGRLMVIDTNSKKKLDKKIGKGYNYILRCKMLILYPDEKSSVWNFVK